MSIFYYFPTSSNDPQLRVSPLFVPTFSSKSCLNRYQHNTKETLLIHLDRTCS